MNKIQPKLLIIAFIIFAFARIAQAQTSAFTYQGRLTDSSAQANGTYDLGFALFDAPSGGTQIGDSQTRAAVNVLNGVFTVQLDFGANPFQSGANRFLEIAVRRPSNSAFTTLTPRQQLTSAPFSIQSLSATTANGLSNNCVACVTDAQIDTVAGTKVTGTVNSALTANAATTATTAGNVSGIVDIANGGTGSSTKNFVDLTTAQTVGGNKTFTGVLSGDGSGLRNISGASIAGSTVLNPQRLAILRWYDVNKATLSRPIAVGRQPRALAFDGTFVYAANSIDSTVTRIRASTGVVEGSPIAVGNTPRGLAFDGTFVYAANSSDKTVTRIRAGTGVVEGSAIAVGNRPQSLTFDGTFVYAANSIDKTVTRIRASTGVVEGSPIAVGSNPLALTFDGTFVYAANNGDNTVTRIRAGTGAVEGSPIAVGDGPLALTFDGTFVYVANFQSNTVTRIRASTGAVEGDAIAVGISIGLYALAFDGTFVYVSDIFGNTVTRF